jgi:hypothetical protein
MKRKNGWKGKETGRIVKLLQIHLCILCGTNVRTQCSINVSHRTCPLASSDYVRTKVFHRLVYILKRVMFTFWLGVTDNVCFLLVLYIGFEYCAVLVTGSSAVRLKPNLPLRLPLSRRCHKCSFCNVRTRSSSLLLLSHNITSYNLLLS